MLQYFTFPDETLLVATIGMPIACEKRRETFVESEQKNSMWWKQRISNLSLFGLNRLKLSYPTSWRTGGAVSVKFMTEQCGWNDTADTDQSRRKPGKKLGASKKGASFGVEGEN